MKLTKILSKKVLKKNLIAVLLLSSVLTSNVYADSLECIKYITAFMPLLKKNAGTIWPGFKISEKPLFIVSDDDYVYALNFTPKDIGWQKQIINNLPVYVYKHYNFDKFNPTLKYLLMLN